MTMKINRFEAFNIGRVPKKVEFGNGAIVLIKDHLDDRIIAHIQATSNADKNLELANLVIGTIETFLESEENEG